MARARGLDIADHLDDRPARRSRQLRRSALELPARRVRGARARRADGEPARADRAGDPGCRRLLHGPARDRGDEGCRRRHRGGVPRGEGLQLHEPGQHRRPGVDDEHRHPARLALRRPVHLHRGDRRCGRAGSRACLLDDGGAQPRVLERRAHLRRRGSDSVPPRGGRRAARPWLVSHAARAADPAARRDDGRDPGRLLSVLLLARRGARRAACEANNAGRGHPLLGAGVLGALRCSGGDGRSCPRSRIAPAAGSTSSSLRSMRCTRSSTTPATFFP